MTQLKLETKLGKQRECAGLDGSIELNTRVMKFSLNSSIICVNLLYNMKN